MAWAEMGAERGTMEIGTSDVENHLTQQLPGCNYDKSAYGGRGVWRAPLSWAGYVTLMMLFSGQELLIGPQLTAWAWQAYRGVEYAWQLRQLIDDSGGTPEDRELLAKFDAASVPLPDGSPRALYPPQRGGAIYLAYVRRGALNDDQGNGKTPQVIRALQLLAARGQDPYPALVICTDAAKFNWQREFATWAPEVPVRVIDGGAAARKKQIAEAAEDQLKCPIHGQFIRTKTGMGMNENSGSETQSTPRDNATAVLHGMRPTRSGEKNQHEHPICGEISTSQLSSMMKCSDTRKDIAGSVLRQKDSSSTTTGHAAQDRSAAVNVSDLSSATDAISQLSRQQYRDGLSLLRCTCPVMVSSWAGVRMHSRLAAYPGVRFTRCVACGGIDDAITASRCQVHEKELNQIAWRTVVADEAHRLGDARSQQTRAVWWLMQSAQYRWPVTGTPIADNIGNLWPVMHALDPASAPSRSRYLDLFAVKTHGWGGKGTIVLDIRPDTAPAFHAAYQPMMRRIPRAVALPWLPERMPPVFRYPPMSPAQKRMYGQLKKDSLALLEDTADLLVPQNSLEKFGRLCQLAASMIAVTEIEGPDGFPAERVDLVLPSSKVDDLLDFLEDNPGPLVVAANSPRLIALAERKLDEKRITHCKIIGGMSAESKEEAKEIFQRGERRVIFITSAGAESITLTASSTIFFMQPEPSLLAREQKIGRVDRIGSQVHDSIRIIYSITPGTVEERLYKLGGEKEERAASVTRDKELLRWLIQGDIQKGTEVSD